MKTTNQTLPSLCRFGHTPGGDQEFCYMGHVMEATMNSIMKTIETKYYGPTDTRGSRIKATDGDNTVWIGYPHELNAEDGHKLAAETLRDKLGWDVNMIQGATKRGYVFVLVAK